MSSPAFTSAGDLGTDSERLHLAELFREAGVSAKRFVDVEDGEKRTFDHTQRDADGPKLSGNYGIYAGHGGDDSGLWLVELDVDYHEEGIDPDGLAAVEAVSSETLAIESPHTSEEAPGHRLVAVTDEDGEQVNVADALKRAFDVMNPSPTWGEVRVKNQMTVGPGSQIDPGEHGCDKDWCEECAEPYGGHYRIARNESITTITIEELIETIRADANYPDQETTTDKPSSRNQSSTGNEGVTEVPDLELGRSEGTDEPITNEAGLVLDDLRAREGEEQLDALLTELNPEAYEYPSRSEADLATASLLWHRGFEREAIARILRHYRQYEKTQNDEYLARTITKVTRNDRRAFDFTNKYQPRDEETTAAARARIPLTIDGRTPFECWRTVANADSFRRRFLDSLHELLGDVPDNDRTDELVEQGVDALNGVFAEVCTSLARAKKPEPEEEDTEPDPKWYWQFWDALRVLRQFGANTPSSIGSHLPLRDVRDGPLAVFRAVDDRPIAIDVTVSEGFREQRADQRREICWLLATLEENCGFDIEFESTDLREWFRTAHREYRELIESTPEESSVCGCAVPPGSDPPRGEAEQTEGKDDLVRSHWRVLEIVEAAQGGEATYHSLYNHDLLPISNERVRGVLADLRRSNLVQTEGPRDRRCASLTPAGERALSHHDATFGRESTLDRFGENSGETGEEPPQTFRRIRVSPATSSPAATRAADRDHDGRRDHRSSSDHPIKWLSRHEHAAIASAADAGSVGLIDHPVESTGTSPIASYDETRDEFLAGTTIQTAVTGLACTARAFMTAFSNNGPLSIDRLQANVDFDEFEDRLRLVHCSQAGYWSKDERTATDFVDRLRTAEADIMAALKDWSTLRQRGEDVKELSQDILRNSQGLIGTISWLLHECGVDFSRVFYLPDYARNWHTSEDHRRRRSLLRTISLMTTIGSSYGAYNAQRVMYEGREEKRRYQLGAPDVDAADPTGDLLGSFVLAGKGIEKIVDPADGPSLPNALDSPGELQEDAINYAEFEVPISIQSDRSRTAVQEAISRMCSMKNIRPTAAAISAFDGLVGSVFDVTKALNYLGAEHPHHQRPIHLDEVRYALARVPTERLLPDQGKPSVGKVLKACLTADEALSQSALGDRAKVVGQTLRNNADVLTALSVLERRSLGPGRGHEWRCTLPRRSERHSARDAVPWEIEHETDTGVVENGDRQPAQPDASGFEEIIVELTRETSKCGTDSLSHPNSPLGSEVVADGGTVGGTQPPPKLARWISVAASLTGTRSSDNNGVDSTATIGRPPAQCGL